MALFSDHSSSRPGTPAANKSILPVESGRSELRSFFSGIKAFFAIFLIVTNAVSQTTTTTINLGTQGRNPDFANLPFTRPVSVGATLPSACQVGQLFFSTSASAGANLYGCTALNVWSALSASASGSTGSGGTGSGGGSTTPGTGAGSLSTTSVSFGNQTTGTSSPAQPVIFSNTGSGALTISGISVTGSSAGDFVTSNNCGSSLASGMSCTIAVSFMPSTASAETATLNVADNGPGSPHTVSLSGTGTTLAATGTGPAITPAAPATTVGTPITLTANKTVTWSLAPGSAGTITANGTSVTYTPPSSIAPQNVVAGCMVGPSDAVFNTRIDNLPVHAQSATWMGSFIAPVVFLVSWGTNIIDNTTPQTPMFFHYTTNYNGNFQIAPQPSRKRETGSLTVDPNNDHHLMSVNHQTCQFTETYQDGIPVQGCPACNAASGYQYSSTSYAQATQGTTDAAGLPLAPLTLHLSEIKAGAINHAMRFTLCTGCIYSGTYLWPATGANGSNTPNAPPMGARFRLKPSLDVSGVFSVWLTSGGTGYTSSPRVAINGCTTAPTATAMVSGGSVSSIVLNSSGAGCSNPTVTIGGPGSGAAASTTTFSPLAQVVLKGLQRYGMFLADNGGSGQIETDSDVLEDPAVASALGEIGSASLGASYFDVVDESSLMINANSSEVNPNNGYVTPANYAVVQATDASGNVTSVPIALQAVTVGTPYSQMTILAGTPSYQLQSWVNGSTNQNVTWAVTSGPGTVTSSGVYTAPASVSATTPVVLTGTAAADPTATVTVWMNVIPNAASPSNSIRIDVGSSSPTTDAAGNVWLADTLGWESGSYSNQYDGYPGDAWGTVVDQNLYKSYNYTWGDDISYGPFVVPNGNYKVGFGLAKGACSGTYSETSQFDDGLIWGPVALEAQGQIQLHFDLGKAVNYACRTPYTAYVPARVTNNVIYVSVRATGGGGSHSAPFLNTLSIIPDSTPAYLSIDTQQVTTAAAGAVLQMYAVGWYMSNSVTWSVTGGGTIDQTGLYSAPLSLSSNATVTITATSTVNPSISATTTLTITP